MLYFKKLRIKIPNLRPYFNVRKLDIDTLPVVDGFLYGFPCNDFSLVGETKGLHGNFGGLYTYGVKYISCQAQ